MCLSGHVVRAWRSPVAEDRSVDTSPAHLSVLCCSHVPEDRPFDTSPAHRSAPRCSPVSEDRYAHAVTVRPQAGVGPAFGLADRTRTSAKAWVPGDRSGSDRVKRERRCPQSALSPHERALFERRTPSGSRLRQRTHAAQPDPRRTCDAVREPEHQGTRAAQPDPRRTCDAVREPERQATRGLAGPTLAVRQRPRTIPRRRPRTTASATRDVLHDPDTNGKIAARSTGHGAEKHTRRPSPGWSSVSEAACSA